MTSWREERALLADPRFLLLLGSRVLSVLGASFAPVALAFGVLQIANHDAAALSVVLACESVPMLLLMLVGGVIADRLPRSRVIAVGCLASGLAFGAIGALMLAGVRSLVPIGAAAALSGVSIAVTMPALTGVIPEIVPKDRLQSGNALLGFGANVSRILGVVVAGLVVAAVGGSWALVVAAAMFGLGALGASQLRTPSPRAADAAGGVFADLRDGWGEFRSREWLWVVVAQWSLLVLCFAAAHGVLGPVIADRDLGGPKPWSWILAGESAGSVAGVLAAMRWRPRRPILVPVVATTLTLPVPFILLGLGAPLAAIIATAVLSGASMSIFGILWSTTMQREVPAHALSRVSSYDALGSMILEPVGLLVAGPVAAAIGARPAMLACGLALVVICAAALASRDVRTLSWRDGLPEPDGVPATPAEL